MFLNKLFLSVDHFPPDSQDIAALPSQLGRKRKPWCLSISRLVTNVAWWLLFDHHPGRRHLLTRPLPAELQNVCHNKSASGQWNRGAKSVGIAPHGQWLAQLHTKHCSVAAKGGVGYCNTEHIVEPIISLNLGNIFQIITQLRVVLFLPKIQDNLWKLPQDRSQGSSEKYLWT